MRRGAVSVFVQMAESVCNAAGGASTQSTRGRHQRHARTSAVATEVCLPYVEDPMNKFQTGRVEGEHIWKGGR